MIIRKLVFSKYPFLVRNSAPRYRFSSSAVKAKRNEYSLFMLFFLSMLAAYIIEATPLFISDAPSP